MTARSLPVARPGVSTAPACQEPGVGVSNQPAGSIFNKSGRYELRPLTPRCSAYHCTELATHELVGPELHPKLPYMLCHEHGMERLGALA